MRCPECNQLLLSDATRCPACGAVIDASYSGRFQEETPDTKENDIWERQNNEEDGNTAYEWQNEYTRPKRQRRQNDMPMKWYWFLTRISLLLTAVMNVFTGIASIMGYNYGTPEVARQVYEVYPIFKGVDIAYGLVTILFGIYAYYVRHMLLKYKRKGPKHLLMLYAISACIGLLYTIIATVVTGTDPKLMFDTMTISSLVSSVVMIILNKIYFDHRAHLFTED